MRTQEDNIGYQAWLRRGILLRETRHYDEAISSLEKAIMSKPEAPAPFLEIARCLADSGRPQEALSILEKGQSLDPNDSFPNSLRSWIFCNMGRPKAAKTEAAAALQKSPHDLFALRSLGRAWSIMRNWPKTKSAAEEVLAIDPQCTYALNLLATAERGMGHHNESRDIVANILRIDPENPWAHANAGFNYLYCGDQKRAEGHFRESLRLNARYGYARHGLLRALEARFCLCRWSDCINTNQRWIRYIMIILFVTIVGSFALLGVYKNFPVWLTTCLSTIFGIDGLIICFSLLFLVFSRLSRSLMRLSHLYDPQMNDLLDYRKKSQALFISVAFSVSTVLIVASGLIVLILPLLFYIGLIVWASLPKRHAEYMELEEHDHSEIENSTVTW